MEPVRRVLVRLTRKYYLPTYLLARTTWTEYVSLSLTLSLISIRSAPTTTIQCLTCKKKNKNSKVIDV